MRHAQWSELAESSWKALKERSPADADRLALAVDRFAKTGEGRLEQVSVTDETCCLYVDNFILMLGMPGDEMIVEVLWMYRHGGDK